MTVHSKLQDVTNRIIERSAQTRGLYLDRMRAAQGKGPSRAHLSCSGQAHAFAAAGEDQDTLATGTGGNLGIVTAYNDML
jgi:phosphogluconate dehydratase